MLRRRAQSDVARPELAPTLVAGELRCEPATAPRVLSYLWWPVRCGVVAVAPQEKVHEHRPEFPPFGRRDVLEARWVGLVWPPLQKPFLDKPGQPAGEDATGDPEAGLQVVEAASPPVGVAQDQQRPSFAYHLEGAGDRTRLPRVGAVQHANSLYE